MSSFLKYSALCICIFAANAAKADTWRLLTPSACPTSSANLFTTGQQYVSYTSTSVNYAGDGVPQDSWSMLVRWQGNPTIGNTQWISNPLNYNAGIYSGYTPPTPYSTWQRGYQPESQYAETPGVQLHCFDAGMVLNSFYTPHNQDVVGGGFNDMYGYSWSSAKQPFAFKMLKVNTTSGALYWEPSDLVLQGDLSVPSLNAFLGTKQSNGTYSWSQQANANTKPGYGGFGYFAYLVDTTHANLPPIAFVVDAFASGDGAPYQCPSSGLGNVGYDYSKGVWFGASGFCNSDISTIHYTAGVTTDAFFGLTFYRVHFTPRNWQNLITRINDYQCGGDKSPCKDSSGQLCATSHNCPPTGYSTDPNVYKLQYFGVIAETDLVDPVTGSVGTSVANNNVEMAAYASWISAYGYTLD